MGNNVNDVVTLREKGSEGINRASRKRNDLIQTVPGQKVHQTCRREHYHPNKINRAKKKVQKLADALWTARLTSPLTLKLTVSSAEQTLIWRIRREGWGRDVFRVTIYCESVLYFWKHIFLICMFEKESGLVTA